MPDTTAPLPQENISTAVNDTPEIPTTSQSELSDRISIRPLSDFSSDPANVRLHPDANKDAILASFKRFGPGRSIVADGKNVIRAGNGALEAARAAGAKRAIIIEPKPDELVVVRRPDWSDTEATGYAIADNRATDLSHFDDDALIKQMEALKAEGMPLEDIGFNDDELESLIAENTEQFADDGEMLAKLSVTIAEPKTEVEHLDIWRLGNHVLIIAEVLYEHQIWSEYLQPDSIFCPYPGPLVALTQKADANRLVMVQPDHYIAGHCIDKWNEAHPNGPFGELIQRESKVSQ